MNVEEMVEVVVVGAGLVISFILEFRYMYLLHYTYTCTCAEETRYSSLVNVLEHVIHVKKKKWKKGRHKDETSTNHHLQKNKKSPCVRISIPLTF